MLQKITILIGTMTGNAQLVAQDLELRFDGDGIPVETRDMDKLTPKIFDNEGIFLISTSTYGQGDVPDNARDFVNLIEDQKPDLSSVRYGLIALGDRTYAETFCYGGKRIDDLLQKMGAQRIGAPLYHDASTGTMPEEEAAEWAEEWMKLVTAPPIVSANSWSSIPPSKLLADKYLRVIQCLTPSMKPYRHL